MTKPENPTAFPQSAVVSPSGDIYTSPDNGGEGMTLRDYFAGIALGALLPQSNTRCLTDLDWADRAYQVADTMLKARQTNDNR